MKINELFEAGKSIYARMAAENRARQQKEREAEKARRDAEKKRAAAERAAKRKKPSDSEILDKVEGAIGNSFPDGDPADHFMRWLDMKNLTMSDVDRVFKKHRGVTYDQYLIRMWDDFAADAVHDAENQLKQGKHPDPYSPFFAIENGKVVKSQNPWK